MKKMGVLCCVAAVLVIIGGLSWGIIGIFGYNVVEAVFGAGSVLTRIVYVAIGLAALYMTNGLLTCSHCCGKGGTCDIEEHKHS